MKAALTDKQVIEIRKKYINGATHKKLAEEFGVTMSVINLVINHKGRYKNII